MLVNMHSAKSQLSQLIEVQCPFVSKDEEFDSLQRTPGWLGRIWT